MAIVRIFRVEIDPNLRDEFEKGFATISVNAVKHSPGLLSETIQKPTKWAPDEYAMISHWASEVDLEAFAGSNWNQTIIPEEMAKYVINCWVHHYAAW